MAVSVRLRTFLSGFTICQGEGKREKKLKRDRGFIWKIVEKNACIYMYMYVCDYSIFCRGTQAMKFFNSHQIKVMDGLVDGWMDGWMGGWVDVW